MKNVNDLSTGSIVSLFIFFLMLVVFFFVVGPWFTLWSLNTVFGLGLVMTFKMWMSLAWLGLLVGGGAIKYNSRD